MRSTKKTKAAIAAAAVAATGLVTATAPTPVALAGSIANIPANILQAVANLPAEHVAGLNNTSNALEEGGNWWLYTPGNVLGYDQADILKINGIMSLLVPFPEVAQALADPINVTFEANFPMTEICTGAPAPCADPTYWTAYFKVMPWKLIQGVTYGDVRNTIDPSISMPWSNTTQRINLFGVPQAVWESLTKDPEGFKGLPTLEEAVKAYVRLAAGVFNSLNPFVEGTYCLPCQLVGVKGAPGSLAQIPLFGNWYTVTDFGQPLTDDNWVGRPPGVPKAPDVDALSLWSPEGQARLWADIDASFKRLMSGDVSDIDKMVGSFEKVFSGFTALIPAPSDFTGTLGAIGSDFTGLLDSITSTVKLPDTPAAKAPASTALTAPAPASQTSTAATESGTVDAPVLVSPLSATARSGAPSSKIDGPRYTTAGDGYLVTSPQTADSGTTSIGSGSTDASTTGKHRAPESTDAPASSGYGANGSGTGKHAADTPPSGSTSAPTASATSAPTAAESGASKTATDTKGGDTKGASASESAGAERTAARETGSSGKATEKESSTSNGSSSSASGSGD